MQADLKRPLIRLPPPSPRKAGRRGLAALLLTICDPLGIGRVSR